jgi:hypothetical protein
MCIYEFGDTKQGPVLQSHVRKRPSASVVSLAHGNLKCYHVNPKTRGVLKIA